MKKQFFHIILCVALLVSQASFSVSALTENGAAVSLNSETAAPGGTVELTVSIENNPGIAGYLFYLAFDTDIFTLEGIENSSGGYIYSNDYFINGEKAGVSVVRTSSTNFKEDGIIFSIRLQVSEGAKIGEYSVGLSYSKANTINENGKQVGFSTKNGKIMVQEPEMVLSSQSSAPGKDVAVLLSLQNSPGITGMSCTIAYDTGSFELVDIKNKMGGELVHNKYIKEGSHAGEKLAWIGSSSSEKELALFLLIFHADKDIQAKDYIFTIEEAGLSNQNSQLILPKRTEGILTISAPTVTLSNGEIKEGGISFYLENDSGYAGAIAVCSSYSVTGQMTSTQMVPIALTDGKKSINLLNEDFSYVKVFVLEEETYIPLGNALNLSR